MKHDFTFLLVAVNAKYIHSNPALYSLKAYAGKKYRRYIRLAEFTINELTENILEGIYNAHPQVIGLSCYIWNMQVIEMLLRELPKILPDTDIFLGGPEVSFDAPVWMKKYPQLTGIMIGEGEATFKDLIAAYTACDSFGDDASADKKSIEKPVSVKQSTLHSIPGLCLPDGFTAPREALDLSEIPFIYEDLTPFAHRIIYYESSRGCPYSCSYCLSSIDKKVRLRSTDLVEKELQFFLDQKVPQVKFVDRTFNCHREHTRRIWTYLRDHDNGLTNFHFEISADVLNEEEIALLSALRPGLVQLEIGVQSTNEETIREIHRVMDVEKLSGIVERIRCGRNVHQHLDLIVGLPYENYESFGRSFDRVYAMRPDQLQMGFLKLLKGSYMYEHRQEYGISHTDAAPYEVLSTNWITYGEIRRLKRIEAMVELYENSRQLDHAVPYLISFFDGPFAFFESLAEFYRSKGYFIQTPARGYRYQVLLEFGAGVKGLDAEALRELLVYDMYLRENLKSRPVFAPEITSDDRHFQHAFYEKEVQERTFLPEYAPMDAAALRRQTHLERFQYAVWDCTQPDKRLQEKVNVLFDYKSRNPLNRDARTILI